MSYAKWIGGALGWALGGPIGAIFGYAFGSIVGDTSLSIEQGGHGQPQGRPGPGPRRRQTGSGDFAASMIVLSAAVMKADERILKSELDYVKRFFISNFGQQQAERYVLTLREVLKQDVDTRAVCRQIQGMMEHSKRLLLLNTSTESRRPTGMWMSVRWKSFARWPGGSASATRTASPSRPRSTPTSPPITRCWRSLNRPPMRRSKRAYRRMAVKFHPDKVGDMGADYQKQARARFDRIQAAYEEIKQQGHEVNPFQKAKKSRTLRSGFFHVIAFGSLAKDRQAPLALAIREAHRVVTGRHSPEVEDPAARRLSVPLLGGHQAATGVAHLHGQVHLFGAEIKIQAECTERRNRVGHDPIQTGDLANAHRVGHRDRQRHALRGTPTASTDTFQS